MKLLKEVNEEFGLAIHQDKVQRAAGCLEDFRSGGQESALLTDSFVVTTKTGVRKIENCEKKKLSFDETKCIADHICLSLINPIQVIRLDSLFQSNLLKDNIMAETAVVYTVEGKSEYSNTDSLFYKEAISLKPVSFSYINLQGYVKFDILNILIKSPAVWMIFLIWFGLFLFFLGFNLLKWREWRLFKMAFMELPKEPALDLPVIDAKKESIVTPSTGSIRLKDDLYFNEKKGEIIYRNYCVFLSKKSIELLSYLLRCGDWFQTYEVVKKEVWGDEHTSNDAVRNAVNRLNKELEEVPELRVEKLTKVGLKLHLGVKETQLSE